MAGPAVAVFDGVVTPELWGDEPFELEAAAPVQQQPDASPDASPAVDCASVCINGCIRPEACPSAEARARVDALLNSSSLDDLVALATNSLESRIRSRFELDQAQGG
jgi:diaminopimelate epimerase